MRIREKIDRFKRTALYMEEASRWKMLLFEHNSMYEHIDKTAAIFGSGLIN